MSITGTNGKSTVTRLITHILKVAGRRVGTTTSDGVLVDERLVEPGDWTGPGGAWQILGGPTSTSASSRRRAAGSSCAGWATSRTTRASITNVTSDHLDLQGIHTLPELAEVKSTVARATKPGGWAVLNADDPLVAAVAPAGPGERRDVLARAGAAARRRVRRAVAAAAAATSSATAGSSRSTAATVRHDDGAGRIATGTTAAAARSSEPVEHRIIEVDRVPITLGGLARHNVANALAAAGAARGLGRDARPAARRPGRLPARRPSARRAG